MRNPQDHFDPKLRACTVQCCNPKATSTTTTTAPRAPAAAASAYVPESFSGCVRVSAQADGFDGLRAHSVVIQSFSQSASGAAAAARDGDGWMEDGWPGHPPDNDNHVHPSKPKQAPTTACQQHQQARRGANRGGDALGWIRALARGGGGARGAARAGQADDQESRPSAPAPLCARAPRTRALSGRPAESSREIASEKRKKKSPPGGGARRMHSSFSRRTRARRRGAQPTRRAPGGGGGGEGGAARREEGRGKKGAGGGGRSSWPERACGLGTSRLLARVLIRRGGRPVCRWPVCLRGAHHARAGRRGAE